MPSGVPTEIRRLVNERAAFCCEYCLMPQTFSLKKHEPDHIIPIQHGGTTEEQNLALACMRCNRYKGPNLGSIDPQTGDFVPFYNPRKQKWSEHFAMENGYINPLTAEARVTVKILRINDASRIKERVILIDAGIYPV